MKARGSGDFLSSIGFSGGVDTTAVVFTDQATGAGAS